MHVGVTGGSGLLGRALIAALGTDGHGVTKFVREQPSGPGESEWNPVSGGMDSEAIEKCRTVIHLSGAPIASRWTSANKKRIWDSRVESTALVARAVAGASNPTERTLVCASAVGFYGDGGDQTLSEDSHRGQGYLAELTDAWERAATPAAEAGVRVVHLRLGVVLAVAGGALPKMLPAFRFGLGGKLGSGRQYFPWIHLDDAIGTIRFCLKTESLSGPVNIVAPHEITNFEFTKALGGALSRPTLFTVPSFAMRLGFGQMAEEVLIAGQRATPAKLLESGYRFEWPEINEALRDVLSTTEATP